MRGGRRKQRDFAEETAAWCLEEARRRDAALEDDSEPARKQPTLRAGVRGAAHAYRRVAKHLTGSFGCQHCGHPREKHGGDGCRVPGCKCKENPYEETSF